MSVSKSTTSGTSHSERSNTAIRNVRYFAHTWFCSANILNSVRSETITSAF